MATLNSLLFLFSTLAPNVEPPGNLPVTQVPPEWVKGSVPHYGQNVPVLTQMVCPIAEYLSCKSHCQKNCTNYDHDIPCPDICVLGCVCIDPLIRATDGSCIMPYECPAMPDTPVTTDSTDDEILCQSDEEVSPFPHCQRNCTNIGQMIVCSGEGPRGCVCKSPKIRGPEGNCIMSDECPRTLRSQQDDFYDDVDPDSSLTCPPNEEVTCFSHCQANCTNFDKSFNCPMYCVTGCVCILPLIRGPDGSCIMPEQCNALKKTPQRSAAPSACLEEKLTGSCRSHLPRFYFNKETGNCESFIYGGCQGNSNNFNTLEDCEAVCKDSQCQNSEDCNDNDDENENVVFSGPFDNLISCEDKNEVYKLCPSQCPDNCENYQDTRRMCKFICSWPKCECKDGFVRGPNGKCIEPDQCFRPETPSKVCPENEEYKECECNQKNCQNYDKDGPCTPVCEPGCFCKEPMIRDPDGNCIYQEECLAKLRQWIWDNPNDVPLRKTAIFSSVEDCPKNEEYKECGTACQKNCQNYDLDESCTAECESGCFCKEPMIRGPDGNCIYQEECLAKLRQWDNPNDVPLRKTAIFASDEGCPVNEEYKECGTACQKNCQNYDRNSPCEFKCEPGCFCKEPMIRGPSGKCIYREDCPAKATDSKKSFITGFVPDFSKVKTFQGKDWICKKNEEFSLCAPLPMCHDDCTNYKEDRYCKRACLPGCKCIDGYVKGKEGVCIKIEECEERKESDSSEESSDCSGLEVYAECGSYCETDCDNYNAIDRKCEDSRCKKGCFCKSGLVRSLDGKCIAPEDCPAPRMRSWSRKFLQRGPFRQ